MKKITTILFIAISSILFGQTNGLEKIIQLGEDWKFDEAIELLKNEISIYPQNPDEFIVYDGYGECLMLLGQKENAIEAYLKSLELYPENKNLLKGLSATKTAFSP